MSTKMMRVRPAQHFSSQEEFIESATRSFENMLRGYLRRDMKLYEIARSNVELYTLPDVLSDMRELPINS